MRQEHDRFGYRLFHTTSDQNGTYQHPENAKPEVKPAETKAINCGRDTGDECPNHNPQPRYHEDECTNTHTLRSKL